jgi:hypothetical protein
MGQGFSIERVTPKFRYAFDWGGTLNCNPELMEIAKNFRNQRIF